MRKIVSLPFLNEKYMTTSDIIRIAFVDDDWNIIESSELLMEVVQKLKWDDAQITDFVLEMEYGLPQGQTIQDGFMFVNGILDLFDQDHDTKHVLAVNVVKNDVNGLGQELWLSTGRGAYCSDLNEDPETEELTTQYGRSTTFEEEVRGLAKSVARHHSLRGKKKDRALGLMCHLFAVSA